MKQDKNAVSIALNLEERPWLKALAFPDRNLYANTDCPLLLVPGNIGAAGRRRESRNMK